MPSSTSTALPQNLYSLGVRNARKRPHGVDYSRGVTPDDYDYLASESRDFRNSARDDVTAKCGAVVKHGSSTNLSIVVSDKPKFYSLNRKRVKSRGSKIKTMALHNKVGKTYNQLVTKTKSLLSTSEATTPVKNCSSHVAPSVNFYPDQPNLVMNNTDYFLGGGHYRRPALGDGNPSSTVPSNLTLNSFDPGAKTKLGNTTNDGSLTSFTPGVSRHVISSSFVARDLLKRRSGGSRGNAIPYSESFLNNMDIDSESDASSTSSEEFSFDMKRRMFLSLSSTDVRNVDNASRSSASSIKTNGDLTIRSTSYETKNFSKTLPYVRSRKLENSERISVNSHNLSLEKQEYFENSSYQHQQFKSRPTVLYPLPKPRPPERSSSLKNLSNIDDDYLAQISTVRPALKPKPPLRSTSLKNLYSSDNNATSYTCSNEASVIQRQQFNSNLIGHDTGAVTSATGHFLPSVTSKPSNNIRGTYLGSIAPDLPLSDGYKIDIIREKPKWYSDYFSARKNVISKKQNSSIITEPTTNSNLNKRVLVRKPYTSVLNPTSAILSKTDHQNPYQIFEDLPVPLERTKFISRRNPDRYSPSVSGQTYNIGDNQFYMPQSRRLADRRVSWLGGDPLHEYPETLAFSSSSIGSSSHSSMSGEGIVLFFCSRVLQGHLFDSFLEAAL